MADYDGCTEHCERMPECPVCGLTKKPIGRDAAVAGPSYCDSDCPAYRSEPTPGHLWPGELARIRDEVSRG